MYGLFHASLILIVEWIVHVAHQSVVLTVQESIIDSDTYSKAVIEERIFQFKTYGDREIMPRLTYRKNTIIIRNSTASLDITGL